MCYAWLRSSLGKKTLMAISGLMLVGFVIMHLAGNLFIYGGPSALNAYAEKLRHVEPLVWAVRFVLLVATAVHIVTSIQLTHENAAARPQHYAAYRTNEATFAGRTMILSGLLGLAYLIYHLLHFTFRVTNPDISHGLDALGRRDVYAMVVRSFQQPLISLAYVAGLAALCLHLGHGLASSFQTLGFNNERTLPILTRLGRLFALVLFIGYASIPVAVLLGVIR